MNRIADKSIAGKSCSICQSVIISGEQITLCDHCHLPFHRECWDENKGCSAYGCEGAAHHEKDDVVPEFTSQNVWGGTKFCPSCGEEIKGQAIKCRFCGATFSSRDAISRNEYENREYDGKELAKARNWVVILFIASATGCLSPIMFFVTGFLLLFKSLGVLQLNRLPQALKAICYVAFGVNVFMVLFLIFILIFDS